MFLTIAVAVAVCSWTLVGAASGAPAAPYLAVGPGGARGGGGGGRGRGAPRLEAGDGGDGRGGAAARTADAASSAASLPAATMVNAPPVSSLSTRKGHPKGAAWTRVNVLFCRLMSHLTNPIRVIASTTATGDDTRQEVAEPLTPQRVMIQVRFRSSSSSSSSSSSKQQHI
jgi:hypothetical protein